VGGQRHAPTNLHPGNTRYLLYRRLGGPQGRSEQVRKISPPPEFDPGTVQPVASRYTDCPLKCVNMSENMKIRGSLKSWSAANVHRLVWCHSNGASQSLLRRLGITCVYCMVSVNVSWPWDTPRRVRMMWLHSSASVTTVDKFLFDMCLHYIYTFLFDMCLHYTYTFLFDMCLHYTYTFLGLHFKLVNTRNRRHDV